MVEIMKINKILILLSFILVVLLCISSVSASEEGNNLTSDSPSLESSLDEIDSSQNVKLNVSRSSVSNAPSSSNTIVVEEVEKDHNEMNDPTIQKAIDNAKAGDTIIVNGTSYVHCHFIINKKLTIISNVGTTLEPCGSNAISGYRGIFYISPEASGTVISGFTIKNDVSNSGDYGILVKGASNVKIENCTFSNSSLSSDAIRLENGKDIVIENVSISKVNNGIKISNSENVKVISSLLDNAKYCINVIDSNKININSNNITNNIIAGIAVSGSSKNVVILSNNMSKGNIAINLTVANNVCILSNYIGLSNKYGVYTNCNITKMEIKGNFIDRNGNYNIFNDHRVKNLFVKGGENKQVITNNYMIGGENSDRPVWRQVYEYRPGEGEFTYDPVNDYYTYVGENNGDYYGHQSGTFMGYVLVINQFIQCPNIYFSYPTNGVTPWTKTGNYNLYLSNITQVKKGVYSISIVDVNGNVAKEISSVPVTFYLMKKNLDINGKQKAPQESDIFKVVMMKNGTATVRFYPNEFNEADNVLLASFPGIGNNIYSNMYRPYKLFNIDDKFIPGNVSDTKIIISNLNTYPYSNAMFNAVLKDADGNPIANEIVKFTINGKSYNVKTDVNGVAKLKIAQSKEGKYTITVNYVGDDVDYKSSSAKAIITVKKVATKISSSNVYMIPNMAEYYSITLRDASNHGISSAKVTIKVNKKTYTVKTDKNGVAELKLKFSKQGTYSVAVKFAGSSKYNAVSKTSKIVVKYSSKTAKLTVPKVTILPKTYKYYTISLKKDNGKGIAKQKITIKLNGKTYSKTTNSNGNVVIKVKFSSLKSYKVSASYKGSKVYKKVSSVGKIVVAKSSTKFTAPKITILPNEKKVYTTTLKTSAGKALSKQKVSMTLNGKTYSKITNSKGQASFDVKLSSEKVYPVVLKYSGNTYYNAAKATGSITVSKIATQLTSYDKTFANDSSKNFTVILKDKSGNALKNQKITFTFNNQSLVKTTDEKGIAFINLNECVGSFKIISKYSGNNQYKSVSNTNLITISNKTNVVFIDANLPNSEIQNILDNCDDGSNVEFLGDLYKDISLNINKALNIYSTGKTVLNAKSKSPVFKILASNVNIYNLSIVGNANDGIEIINANNVKIFGNNISNLLDESKIKSYMESTISLPNYGINVVGSKNIEISNNSINKFESGIFVSNSNNIAIDSNVLMENNYGVKYGFGVANSNITNNFISESIGLYTNLVPEGPRGYGVFLNNSAVNVTITKNNISWNHLGISIDANYSTGILITSNLISDNVLEGIRFNEGYDLAQNAIEPVVTDNAIYRNGRGPSMMILGELSANPAGIYGPGAFNDSLKLKIGLNWYGKNQIITWDNDTGIVGYGTMCPRINTTGIAFKNITCVAPGTYSITFYKNDEIASKLPVFNMYATLNDDVEVVFDVVNGTGVFSFDAQKFISGENVIKVSSGSLKDMDRIFKVEMSKTLESSEIPI